MGENVCHKALINWRRCKIIELEACQHKSVKLPNATFILHSFFEIIVSSVLSENDWNLLKNSEERRRRNYLS